MRVLAAAGFTAGALATAATPVATVGSGINGDYCSDTGLGIEKALLAAVAGFGSLKWGSASAGASVSKWCESVRCLSTVVCGFCRQEGRALELRLGFRIVPRISCLLSV